MEGKLSLFHWSSGLRRLLLASQKASRKAGRSIAGASGCHGVKHVLRISRKRGNRLLLPSSKAHLT